MNPDDDVLTGPVPVPDAEPTPAERAHARTFANIIDKTLSGRTPAAMSADDRALLEVATVIRATSGAMELSPSKQRSVVEDVLRQAIGEASPNPRGAVTPRASLRRGSAPWAIASVCMVVAAAAVLVLWMRAPRTVAVIDHEAPPVSWSSRPADRLIGPIAREHAGEASSRIDTIYADRLDGFRDRQLARGGSRKP